LEAHTVSSLLKVIKANNWEKEVELVRGGRQVLMFSETEENLAKRDWKEAQEAGLDCANEVEWLSIEETKNVECFLITRIRVLTDTPAIRGVLSVLPN
jgi:hypothetical protein